MNDYSCVQLLIERGQDRRMEELRISLRGLTCSNCAAKIEHDVNKMIEARDAEINLVKQEMVLSLKDGVEAEVVFSKIEAVVHKYEPDVTVVLVQMQAPHMNQEAGCGTDCGCEEKADGVHPRNDSQNDGEDMDLKKVFLRFAVGVGFFLLGVLVFEGIAGTGMLLTAYAIFGHDVLWRAIRNISRGQVFDENFLMSLSTLGALAIGDIPEAVFVMLFYQVGEAFQEYAVVRSKKSITALLDIRPDYADVIVDGVTTRMSPEAVRIGDTILVKAGERIPLDGQVVWGQAYLDTAALTGEALAREVGVGDEVMSGCINKDGTLHIKVQKPFGESTVFKILEMVENAAGKKSKTERFITRFARVYTPVVVGLALLLCIVPPLLGMGEARMWFGRALIFLVVSCPCALVLSVPLTYFAGIGAASKNGILLKGGNYLDTLQGLNTVILDKTGTLTKGVFSLTKIEGECPEELLLLAAAGEAMSNHPIAEAIMKKYGTAELPEISDYRELGGYGISYMMDGEEVLLGNSRLMEERGVVYRAHAGAGTVVYVTKGNRHMGTLVVEDTVKEGAKEALDAVRRMGVEAIVMLTGDREENAVGVARQLGITEYYTELLPQDKLSILEEYKRKAPDKKIAFIGDGINDAPVLAGADIGIAMGGIGSDAAIEAADMLLMDDELGKMSVAIRIAQNTRKLVMQNIVLALAIKAFALILSAAGMASMWMAVFADVGVTVLAILNAMRKK